MRRSENARERGPVTKAGDIETAYGKPGDETPDYIKQLITIENANIDLGKIERGGETTCR